MNAWDDESDAARWEEAGCWRIADYGEGHLLLRSRRRDCGFSPQTLRQWTLGRGAREGWILAGHWCVSTYPSSEASECCRFLNLVEVRLIGEFRRLKLPLQYIRQVIDVLEQSYDTGIFSRACVSRLTASRSSPRSMTRASSPRRWLVGGRITSSSTKRFARCSGRSTSPAVRSWHGAGIQSAAMAGSSSTRQIAFGEPVLEISGIPTRTFARQVSRSRLDSRRLRVGMRFPRTPCRRRSTTRAATDEGRLSYVFDENLPSRIARAINAVCGSACHVCDEGLQARPNEPLRFAAARGAVFVTSDKRIKN